MNRRSRQNLSRPFAFVAAAIVCFFCLPGAEGSPPKDGEYALKAAFLFHFAQLTEWPSEAFQHANDPLTFCAIGKDSIDSSMADVMTGKTIQHRSIRVLHIQQPSEAQSCQVLFIGVEEKPRILYLLNAVRDLPLLTAGETEGFIQQGGMIGFRSDDNRLRFEINVSAAERCRVKFSSVLLSLAKVLITGNRGH
jgi:hypothetical protein